MSNKPRRKSIENVPVAPYKFREQCKKSKMMDNEEEVAAVASTVGREGFSERAKRLGLFVPITYEIRQWCSNPDNYTKTIREFYAHLHKMYSPVFTTEPTKIYPSNFIRVIQREPEWCAAYYCRAVDVQKLAEDKMITMLLRGNMSDANVIKAYDVLNRHYYGQPEDDKKDSVVYVDIRDMSKWSRGDDDICTLN